MNKSIQMMRKVSVLNGREHAFLSHHWNFGKQTARVRAYITTNARPAILE